MSLSIIEWIVLSILLIPATPLLILSAGILFQIRLDERVIARITAIALLYSLSSSLITGFYMWVSRSDQIVIHLGEWFKLSDYSFEFTLLIDKLSLPFMLLTLILSGIVARFSEKYLHRDPGYPRFFTLLMMFVTGMLLLVMGGTVDIMFGGWELVGLASVLLIAFFQYRIEPPSNGLHVLAVYRICDVGLLVGAVLIHHFAHTAEVDVAFGSAHWPHGLFPHIPKAAMHGLALLFVWAAIGKSAQLPFSGWLPRAMEGPTPSSAIFYGGISVHAGAYLLLRMGPLIEQSLIAKTIIVFVGVLTSLYGAFVGRVQSDAKNQLAYATITQLGLIFVEIGAGLPFVALLHICGHASVRTLQFLRSPSVLHEFNRIQAASGGQFYASGLYYEMLIPERARKYLYALAIQRGGVEYWLHRILLHPFILVATMLERFEIKIGQINEIRRSR